ncbi:hypothetical protein HG531_013587 [Fusarium graminearum]|nr:hypothetical protein HG531_013587 [Fusarium graminearum]
MFNNIALATTNGKVIDISLGVYILVLDVVDVGVSCKRAHSATARPIAEDILNQQMVGGILYSDTLVFVADFDVVDMDIGSPDVNTV